MRSYETARTLFGVLELFAWAIFALGILGAIAGAGTVGSYARSGAAFMAALPGVGFSIFGLVFVAIIQAARAAVDSAEYGQQMLQIARDQLEVSRQALNKGAVPTGFQPPKSKSKKGDDPVSGYAADTAVKTAGNSKDRTGKSGFVPIDAGNGFRQMNADATELEYRGHALSVAGGQFDLGTKRFLDLDKVKAHIDALEDSDK